MGFELLYSINFSSQVLITRPGCHDAHLASSRYALSIAPRSFKQGHRRRVTCPCVHVLDKHDSATPLPPLGFHFPNFLSLSEERFSRGTPQPGKSSSIGFEADIAFINIPYNTGDKMLRDW